MVLPFLKIILSCKIKEDEDGDDAFSKIINKLPFTRIMAEYYDIYTGESKYSDVFARGPLRGYDIFGGKKNWKEITIGEWIDMIVEKLITI